MLGNLNKTGCIQARKNLKTNIKARAGVKGKLIK
jgi:hypothetical protein